jgi:hypothetical protein
MDRKIKEYIYSSFFFCRKKKEAKKTHHERQLQFFFTLAHALSCRKICSSRRSWTSAAPVLAKLTSSESPFAF